MRIDILCLIAFVLFAEPLFAHTGHVDSLDKFSEGGTTSNSSFKGNNPYFVEDEVEEAFDIDLSVGGNDGMAGSSLGGIHDGQGSSGEEKHQMSEIKLSKYKIVSTSLKGYIGAVVITLLVGIAFLILNIRRSV